MDYALDHSVVCMQAKSILPLAGVHTLGNLLTNVSLGRVAVSFTHTIKVGTRLNAAAAALHLL